MIREKLLEAQPVAGLESRRDEVADDAILVLDRGLAVGVADDAMGHAAAERQAAAPRPKRGDRAIVGDSRGTPGSARSCRGGAAADRGSHPACGGALGVDQLGANLERHRAIERLDFVDHAHQVSIDQRHQARRTHRDPSAVGEPPDELALEQPAIEVQRALERVHLVVHVELAVLDEQPDASAVGRADYRLSGAREAVRAFRVGDRPSLVKPVEQRSGTIAGRALLPVATHAEVAVRERQNRLELRCELVRRPADDELPRLLEHHILRHRDVARGLQDLVQLGAVLPRREPGEQLPHVGDHYLGACSMQRRRITAPVHADDQPEATLAPRADTSERVFDHHCLGRRHVELARRLQERIGCGLAPQVLLRDDLPVHDLVEEVTDASRREHGAAVLAGRHDGYLDAACAKAANEGDRAWKDLDRVGADQVDGLAVLLIGQLLRGVRVESVVRQLDAARGEKGPGPVHTRLAVDVAKVVLGGERFEMLARALAIALQERVEGLFPGRFVHPRRPGEHTVEIE